MSDLQIKVCGLTRPDNIEDVLSLGVDYVGLIFYEKSQRFAQADALQKWITENPDQFLTTQKVGVFVNAGVDTVLNTVHDYELDYVQLHGEESAGYCAELNLLWSVNTLRKAKLVKAFPITPTFDFAATEAYAAACELFIFDTGGQAQPGGTGKRWDWSLLDRYEGSTPFLLSGGLGPGDAMAVKSVQHPALAGVDLNSRFESEPGIKNVAVLQKFITEFK